MVKTEQDFYRLRLRFLNLIDGVLISHRLLSNELTSKHYLALYGAKLAEEELDVMFNTLAVRSDRSLLLSDGHYKQYVDTLHVVERLLREAI